MQEVGGAVERIDDPGMGLVRSLDQAAFLAQEVIAGTGLGQFLHQHLLGLEVGGGDVVPRALLGDLQLGHLAEIARQAAAGLAGGVDHDLEKGCGRAQTEYLMDDVKRARTLEREGQKGKPFWRQACSARTLRPCAMAAFRAATAAAGPCG